MGSLERERDRDRDRERETERDRERQRETETETERDRETDRERERASERARVPISNVTNSHEITFPALSLDMKQDKTILLTPSTFYNILFAYVKITRGRILKQLLFSLQFVSLGVLSL